MKKLIKIFNPATLLLAVCLLAVGLLCYSIDFRIRAKSTGGTLGQKAGTVVGKAIGSLEGLTIGQKEGYEKGKKDALSKVDTTIELSTKIKEVERLEVLVASGKFSEILKIGEDSPSYAAILSMEYNAIFAIDLSNADIQLKDNKLYIDVDAPEVSFYPVGEPTKENEYQKHGWTGSAEEGHNALNKLADQMPALAEEKFEADESLIKASKTAAENQLIQLANAVSLTEHEIYVSFRD